MTKRYDFSGYATKNDLACSDGRTIVKDAFKDCDGKIVPLVWQHLHNDPVNVMGHALLENRADGVYAYALFNDTPAAKTAKALVQHGDIQALSIYANELVQKGPRVVHGTIREVSLVLAGANPGARIDNLSMTHSDGGETELEDEALIFHGDSGLEVEAIRHEDGEETLQEIFDTLSEKQKDVVYFMLAQALEGASDADGEDTAKHSAEGDENLMKKNVFDGNGDDKKSDRPVLTHADFAAITAEAKKSGSFKDAFLAHATATYGIENIEYLFPDARTVTPTPDPIERDTAWVAKVVQAAKHTPFSRIKSLAADLTADAARARGYVKANMKTETVIRLLTRTTTPTTVYIKDKLDRDDIVDITDMDVVAWRKGEMRGKLDEELGRAVLIGDGRPLEVNLAPNPDKINEERIRPILTDDDLYAHHVVLPGGMSVVEMIDAIIRARKHYKGSGRPTLFTTTDLLTDMLLLKDGMGRRLYGTEAELASALRVAEIVEVPVMEGVTREITEPDPAVVALKAIIVNMKDYTMGADRGGQVSMFDDFDIDFNQMKYLMETRCSGALTRPKSALVIEQEVVEPPAG